MMMVYHYVFQQQVVIYQQTLKIEHPLHIQEMEALSMANFVQELSSITDVSLDLGTLCFIIQASAKLMGDGHNSGVQVENI